MKKILIGLIIIVGTDVYAQIYNPEKAQEYAKEWCGKMKRKTIG